MFNIQDPLYIEDLRQISSYMGAEKKDISVLVTGASGLIGSLITDAFLSFGADGTHGRVRVCAMGRSLAKLEERFEYARGNDCLELLSHDVTVPLGEEAGKEPFDYIIHAASNADPGTYARYPVETIKTNILGTTNMLEYAAKHGSRVLFTSTMEVYGTMPDGTVSKENDFGLVDFNSIRSGYPESKRVSELLCRSYAEEYGADCVITRLGYIYGPTMTRSDNKVIAQFIRSALEKKDIVLKSKGAQRRSYCYAADAVSGIICALFRGEKGAAYNVANAGSVVTIAEMAEIVAGLSGTSVSYDIPDELERKGFSKSQDAVLDESSLRALGWTPRYSMRDGVSRTIDILRS